MLIFYRLCSKKRNCSKFLHHRGACDKNRMFYFWVNSQVQVSHHVSFLKDQAEQLSEQNKQKGDFKICFYIYIIYIYIF